MQGSDLIKTLDDVDHLKTISSAGEEVTCYNPTKISKNGWCKVREGGNIWNEDSDSEADSDSDSGSDSDSEADWGICSPSCSVVNERSIYTLLDF